MVAEQNKLKRELSETVERLGVLEVKVSRHEEVEEKVKMLERAKDGFGDMVAKKISEIQGACNQQEGNLMQVVEGARVEFEKVKKDLQMIYEGVQQKFGELEGKVNGGGKGGSDNRGGYVPNKMAYPKVFSNEVERWREWRSELSKYVDGIHRGMKQCLEEAAGREEEFTMSVLAELVRNHGMQLEDKWKDLYRLLEHRTEGEARKVVTE